VGSTGKDLQALLARYDKPLFAVEARRPLADYDTLGFSLSYELGGTNILEMLRLSRIPITWKVGFTSPGKLRNRVEGVVKDAIVEQTPHVEGRVHLT
jgi:hypothetical protein